MTEDDCVTNPCYKDQEERIADLEHEVKELKRKVDNLVREHRRRWGIARYGEEIKLPKPDKTPKKYR